MRMPRMLALYQLRLQCHFTGPGLPVIGHMAITSAVIGLKSLVPVLLFSDSRGSGYQGAMSGMAHDDTGCLGTGARDSVWYKIVLAHLSPV